MHDQEFECLKCEEIYTEWTWLPSWLFEIDFLYLVFRDCPQCRDTTLNQV